VLSARRMEINWRI